jgi:hypothetical protein
LVFLKDGASELSEVVTKLMIKILEEEKTPEQWKVARIIASFLKMRQRKNRKLPSNQYPLLND